MPNRAAKVAVLSEEDVDESTELNWKKDGFKVQKLEQVEQNSGRDPTGFWYEGTLDSHYYHLPAGTPLGGTILATLSTGSTN